MNPAEALRQAAVDVVELARALIAIPDPPLGKFRADAWDTRRALQRALARYDECRSLVGAPEVPR